jgi:hypothetical protein
LRLPAVVSQAEHLLCAMGGLLFAAGGVIMPENSPPNDMMSLNEGLGAVVTCGFVAWAVAAWRLVHRRMTASAFTRYLLVASIFSLVLGGCALFAAIRLHGEILRVLPAAAFLFVGPMLLRRQQHRLAFWFLASAETGSKSAQRLRGPRNWEPVLWLIAYGALWGLLLDADN